MNQRIFELAKQCSNERLIEYDGGGEYVEVFDKEKFALLIIRECIGMADEFEIEVNRSGLVDRIKEHFGVEL